MFLESLEKRQMLSASITVTQSGGTLTINGCSSATTEDGKHKNSGNESHVLEALRSTYTSYIQQSNATHAGSARGTAGGSGGSGQSVGCDDQIQVIEDNGSVRVIDTFNNTDVTYTGVTKLNINLGGGNDTLLYNGNSIDAQISGGDGADFISVEDSGTANSNVQGGDDNDVITLVHANKTFVDAGAGNDTIYINTGFTADPSEYNYASAEATVKAGNGDDTIWVYAGKSTINGQGGNDDVYIEGGTAQVSSATVHYV